MAIEYLFKAEITESSVCVVNSFETFPAFENFAFFYPKIYGLIFD